MKGELIYMNIKNQNDITLFNAKGEILPRICVINDSILMQEGLKALFEEGFHKDQVIITSRKKYLENYSNTRFDFILTEIEFANEINLEFVKDIRNKFNDSKIIVCTSSINHKYKDLCQSGGVEYFIYWESGIELIKSVIGILSKKLTTKNKKNFQLIESILKLHS